MESSASATLSAPSQAQRVLILGAGGAGKSTLAKKLAHCWDLPLWHLDQLYWQASWQVNPQFTSKLQSVIQQDRWILDGNFSGSLSQRLARAQLVIVLAFSPWHCLRQVLLRRWRYRGRHRPDMAPGCHEQLEMAFLWWILSYRWRKLPALRKYQQQSSAQWLWFAKPSQLQQWLQTQVLVQRAPEREEETAEDEQHHGNRQR